MDAITPTVSGGYGRHAVNGGAMAYYPPNFELSDPLPATERGYHFTGTQYMQLPPAGLATGTPLLLSTSLTFSMWLRPQGTGSRTVFCKLNLFVISVDSDNMVHFSGGYPRATFSHPRKLMDDQWVFVGITFEYESETGRTTLEFYFDGVRDGTSMSFEFYLRDTSLTAIQQIGALRYPFDPYKGFLWRVTFRNYVYTSFALELTASGCPSNLSYCLSPCPFYQSSDCKPCQAACAYGCVRTTDCSLCSDNCKACTGFTQAECTSCILTNANLSDCLCPIGTFPDVSASRCYACHPTCSKCVGGGSNQCLECYNFATLSGDAPTTCNCASEAYPAPDASICRQCDPACLTCVGDGPQTCGSCKSAAFLKASPPSACECNPGFYPDPNASQCSPCPSLCLQCASKSECLACDSSSQLISEVCVCIPGSYLSLDSQRCILCGELCNMCNESGCVSCKSPYIVSSGNCVVACHSGSASNSCDGIATNAPIPALAVTANNSLILSFDQIIVCNLTASDIFIEISTSDRIEIPGNWTDPVPTDGYTFLILLQIESVYIPANTTVSIAFLHPGTVANEHRTAIEVVSVSAILHPSAIPSISHPPSLLTSSTAQQTTTASKGCLSAVITVSLLTGSPTSLITTINQFQLITYIPLSNVSLSMNFKAALAGLNSASIIPNPVYDRLFLNDSSQRTEAYIADFGIESSLFFVNISSLLSVSTVLLLAYVPILLLSRIGIPGLSGYFRRILPSFQWTIPLSICIATYTDIGVFSLLQMLNLSATSNYVLLNCIAACVAFAFFIGSPLLLIVFQRTHAKLLANRENAKFNESWNVVIEPFRTNSKREGVIFYVIFCARRMMLCFSLALLPDSHTAFALLNVASCLLVTFHTEFTVFVGSQTVCAPIRPVRIRHNRNRYDCRVFPHSDFSHQRVAKLGEYR